MSSSQEQKKSHKRKMDKGTKNPGQKTKLPKSGISRKAENLKENKKKEVLNLYIRDKYLNIGLDLYLLFVLGLIYNMYLIMTEPSIGWIFLIFTVICILIISSKYYLEIKSEIDIVLKDLEIIFRK